MATEKYEKNKQSVDNSNAAIKPDPETLNTTDPQEHMEGPISSLIKKTGDNIEEKGAKKEDDE